MENTKWYPVYYNGLETNFEVTKCGRVKRIKKDWLISTRRKFKIGEIDFSELKIHPAGYQRIGINVKGKKTPTVFVHQLVAAVFLGYKWNGHKLVVDHIDSNKLNNHLNNLKLITQRENNSKERTLKSGLPVGVYFHKVSKKYVSQIIINNKVVYLGIYKTIEEASKAYQNKLKEINN